VTHVALRDGREKFARETASGVSSNTSASGKGRTSWRSTRAGRPRSALRAAFRRRSRCGYVNSPVLPAFEADRDANAVVRLRLTGSKIAARFCDGVEHSFSGSRRRRSRILRINACGDCAPYGHRFGVCKARRGSRKPDPQGANPASGERVGEGSSLISLCSTAIEHRTTAESVVKRSSNRPSASPHERIRDGPAA